MLYECHDCGDHFDEPHVEESVEKDEFWGEICYRTLGEDFCPNCGGTNFEEFHPEDDLSFLSG